MIYVGSRVGCSGVALRCRGAQPDPVGSGLGTRGTLQTRHPRSDRLGGRDLARALPRCDALCLPRSISKMVVPPEPWAWTSQRISTLLALSKLPRSVISWMNSPRRTTCNAGPTSSPDQGRLGSTEITIAGMISTIKIGRRSPRNENAARRADTGRGAIRRSLRGATGVLRRGAWPQGTASRAGQARLIRRTANPILGIVAADTGNWWLRLNPIPRVWYGRTTACGLPLPSMHIGRTKLCKE